jgi:hypothetical protein
MRPLPIAAIAVTAGALLAPAAASAERYCGNAGTGQSGLGVSHVLAHDVSCKAARYVAEKARATSHQYRVNNILGVAWRCRITQDATGSEPGSVLTTKVTCISPGGAHVHYHLRS